jgi:hypothetical protein
MHTAGVVTQDKPNTDAEIFISALSAAITSGAGIVLGQLGTTGLYGLVIPASVTGGLALFPSGLLLRTGILQSQNYATNTSQEAFGTAGGPGPNATAGTSGPGGFGAGSVVPPVLSVNLPTLKGSSTGGIKKGIQINFADFIYSVATLAATSITAQAKKVAIPAPGADITPVASNLSAATALSAVINSATTKIHRQRVTMTSPAAFLVDDCDIVDLTFVAITPATSVVTLAGVVLGCSFNYN